MITPFGLTIRKMRLDRKQTKLMEMAHELDITSSYLSAIEHGKKSVSDSFIKKIHLYFKNQGMTLKDWKNLAEDSQPQLKLDLTNDRDVKLSFGRKFDSLPTERKQAIRKILEDNSD